MHRSLPLLSLLLLTACGAPTPLPSPAPPTPAAGLPELQCRGELPAAVAASVEGYRLAQPEDFVASIRNPQLDFSVPDFTCSIFTADFDEDGDRDYALLLVQEESANFRAQYSLNQNGEFESLVLKEFDRLTDPSDGGIYTAMEFKPAGESGLAARDYSPLESPQQEVYIAKPSVSLWRAINTDNTGRPADLNDLSGLSYCSEGFYLVDGELEIVEVCD